MSPSGPTPVSGALTSHFKWGARQVAQAWGWGVAWKEMLSGSTVVYKLDTGKKNRSRTEDSLYPKWLVPLTVDIIRKICLLIIKISLFEVLTISLHVAS